MKISKISTPHIGGKFNKFPENSSKQFPILHLNIRNIKKNFENFKIFLNSLNFTFSDICLSKTWWYDLATLEKFLFELSNYISNHEVYIHQTLDFKLRPELSIIHNLNL